MVVELLLAVVDEPLIVAFPVFVVELVLRVETELEPNEKHVKDNLNVSFKKSSYR